MQAAPHAAKGCEVMSRKERSNGGPQTKSASETLPAEDRAAAITLLAYEKWQARGCPDGDDRRDWFEAEREVLARAGSQSETVSASAGPDRA